MRARDMERVLTDPLYAPARAFFGAERRPHRLDGWLGRFRWWRRRRGGHWEVWYIEGPVYADLWFALGTCTRGTIARPPLGRGCPHCEQGGRDVDPAEALPEVHD